MNIKKDNGESGTHIRKYKIIMMDNRTLQIICVQDEMTLNISSQTLGWI